MTANNQLETLVANAIAAERPSLEDMRAWLDRWPACLVCSAEAHHEVYGEFNEDQIRDIAVVRALVRFVSRCSECQDDIATVFRAVAHRKQMASRRRP